MPNADTKQPKAKASDKIKEITTHETTDGQKFNDKNIAVNHQMQLDIAEMLGFTFDGDKQDMNQVTLQILTKKDELMQYLKEI